MHVVECVLLWVVVCEFRHVGVGVHPVAILSAVFSVICRLWMFVMDASGDYILEAYSSMGLVMSLYVYLSLGIYICTYIIQ